ncbi:hypothetical protein [Pseudomonas sp. UFMG81]|uniref:hypothetical protein n=1 Tax=Pseudomonas sp. UFMG81 TaxID=2745936 RepID=UPI0018902DDA|nr:hypothetical protein [Pseudomonas sp. UFMG81]
MPGIKRSNSTLAYYEHFTQTITLKRAEKPDVVNLANAVFNPDWNAGLLLVDGAEKVLTPLAHEMRHWVDMNCSIRGLRTLENIFRLIADPSDTNAAIRPLKQDLKLDHFVQPYDHTDPAVQYPWQVGFSLSQPNFHEPIEHISLCFFDSRDLQRRRVLFKSPIYLGSMLETCATYQEQRDVLPLFLGEKLPKNARRDAEQAALSFLQNSRVPEYHSIIHAISAAAKQSEAVHGVSLAAGLCTLLLNMPPQMLKESCRRVEDALKNRRYGDGAVSAAAQMRAMAAISPEAALIHNAVTELARRSKSGALPYSDDLLFDLVPFWKKRQAEFFERSHTHFVSQINAIQGPEYFRSSIPALIENNKWIMEQKTLALTLNRLPKRPPIIFGDGFVLDGATEFCGVVPHYQNADFSLAGSKLEILELAPKVA